ncbi:MAG: protein jag [Anaerolineales bacterium]|nr:protein jag [Anaerolineales bacterium]
MIKKRASLEVIAPTVEEAIARGLADLGLPKDAVDVEVLDEGTRGLFGLGARQARIRLTIKSAPVGAAQPSDESWAEPVVEQADLGTALARLELEAEAVSGDEAPALALEPQASPPVQAGAPVEGAEEQAEEEQATLRVARETVQELLEKMKVKAVVTACFGEPDDARSRRPLLVEVHGDDLGILIGRKAETLDALQYIANLIVGKELGRSAPLIVDVEGYRERRGREVRHLAQRMAEQAVKTGRRQYLEPMPANERRLVHIELRNHPDVYTESTGEDPHRKVMIIPKD